MKNILVKYSVILSTILFLVSIIKTIHAFSFQIPVGGKTIDQKGVLNITDTCLNCHNNITFSIYGCCDDIDISPFSTCEFPLREDSQVDSSYYLIYLKNCKGSAYIEKFNHKGIKTGSFNFLGGIGLMKCQVVFTDPETGKCRVMTEKYYEAIPYGQWIYFDDNGIEINIEDYGPKSNFINLKDREP